MNKTVKCFLGCCVVLIICFYTILIILHKPTKSAPTVNIVSDNVGYYKYGIKTEDYLNTCDTIAKYEGLSLTIYVWDGKSYIYYGHQLKRTDSYIISTPDSITAREVLHQDVDEALNEGFKLTHLTGNRLLCVADFIFGYGSPTFIKSGLYKQILINPDDTLKIKAELSKWNKINGKVNPKLVQRRNYDYWLYTH